LPLHYRRGKLKGRINEGNRIDESPAVAGLAKNSDLKDDRNLFAKACALCSLTFDLCLQIHPALFNADMRLRIRSTTLYGIAVARLGHFFEAQRRFNEAHALFWKSQSVLVPHETAIIELRRAEAHLIEASFLSGLLHRFDAYVKDHQFHTDTYIEDYIEEFLKGLQGGISEKGDWKMEMLCREQWRNLYFTTYSPTSIVNRDLVHSIRQQLLSMHLAKLDDGWLTLESAELALSGECQDSLWWARLHTLRLLVYAEHWTPADKPQSTTLSKNEPVIDVHNILAFRERQNSLEFIRRLHRHGRATAGNNLGLLRLIDYATRAAHNLRRLREEYSEHVDSFLKDLKKDLPSRDRRSSLLADYHNIANQQIKAGLRTSSVAD